MNRRTLLAASATLPLCAITRGAAAQGAWPTERPIRIVITYPPGGTSDFVARALAQQLGQQLGQSVVVENRSGGGGVVGWTNLVRSAPDGYSLLVTDNSLATAPALLPNLGFDINADLTPISLLVDYPCIIVAGREVPANSLAEFVAMAKARGGDQVFYGSMGNGSSPHLYAELLQDQAPDLGPDLGDQKRRGAPREVAGQRHARGRDGHDRHLGRRHLRRPAAPLAAFGAWRSLAATGREKQYSTSDETHSSRHGTPLLPNLAASSRLARGQLVEGPNASASPSSIARDENPRSLSAARAS